MPEQVCKTYQLQKISGKGGWTYLEIPEIKPAAFAVFTNLPDPKKST